MHDNTPILIGVGQTVAQIPDDLSGAASHADMAGRAAQQALIDAGLSGDAVDTVACVRVFSDSSPAYACPFGGPEKFPLAVAKRVDAKPKRAVYDSIGGQSPQTLVAEFARELEAGRADVVLIAGGEALANMRAAQRAGATLDWSETQAGDWEDRGQFSGPMIVSPTELSHGLMDPMSYYGFIETARRIAAGRDVNSHRAHMADLLAPMSGVAANNPYAMFGDVFNSEQISAPNADNRPLTTPFLKRMVAKDGVNQGAAVVMTTVGHATKLGIPRKTWVFLRGHAQANENLLLDRTVLGGSVAMDAVFKHVLSAAGATSADIDHADIYSCFPCVIDQAATALDRHGKSLTLTGGLPFFGGPGNNYTLHGICEVVSACRAAPSSLGLAHGNGGWMSKQAVGLYSTEYKETDVYADAAQLAEIVTAQDTPGQIAAPNGHAVLESYIVNHKRGAPIGATAIGQMPTGQRFYAKLKDITPELLNALAAGEMDGARIIVAAGTPANTAQFL